MNMRPGVAEAFMPYRDRILEEGPLGKKERALVLLATVVALKQAHCIQTRVSGAREAGATQDEIVQTLLMVGLQTGMALFQTAHQAAFAGE
jgi:alkylhydroperoxidase/carboxymuconolactone decarboxylase family protein YurZ